MKCEKCHAQFDPYRTLAENVSIGQEYADALEKTHEDEVYRLKKEIQKLKNERSIVNIFSSAFKHFYYNVICDFELMAFGSIIFIVVFNIAFAIKSEWFPGKVQYCYIEEYSGEKAALKIHYTFAFDKVVKISSKTNELKEFAKEYNCENKLR